jgi:hypothetical protein
MNKRKLAIEWLWLLGSVAFGATAIPWIILPAVIGRQGPNYRFDPKNFYEVLFTGDALIAWALLLSPYIVIQIIRSIIWAIGAIRNET